MSGPRKHSRPAMRTVGSLKLPPEDVEKYKKALEHYDIERSSGFLRRCAYALIRHYEAGDELPSRLSFKIPKNPKHGPQHC
jgi:hypothetical protein